MRKYLQNIAVLFFFTAFMYLFIYLLFYLFIHLFIYAFTHSLIHSSLNLHVWPARWRFTLSGALLVLFRFLRRMQISNSLSSCYWRKIVYRLKRQNSFDIKFFLQTTAKDCTYDRTQTACANYMNQCYTYSDSFFIPIYASCYGRRDVGQENANILQHLQSDRRSGGGTKLFLNVLIQFYLTNVTNLHQLTSHIRHQALQHGDRIVTIDYCDVTSPYV